MIKATAKFPRITEHNQSNIFITPQEVPGVIKNIDTQKDFGPDKFHLLFLGISTRNYPHPIDFTLALEVVKHLEGVKRMSSDRKRDLSPPSRDPSDSSVSLVRFLRL